MSRSPIPRNEGVFAKRVVAPVPRSRLRNAKSSNYLPYTPSPLSNRPISSVFDEPPPHVPVPCDPLDGFTLPAGKRRKSQLQMNEWPSTAYLPSSSSSSASLSSSRSASPLPSEHSFDQVPRRHRKLSKPRSQADLRRASLPPPSLVDSGVNAKDRRISLGVTMTEVRIQRETPLKSFGNYLLHMFKPRPRRKSLAIEISTDEHVSTDYLDLPPQQQARK